MRNRKIVIALGGNALQSGRDDSTAESQLDVVKKTCEYISEISMQGYEMAVVHGNGPQVGRILLASEAANDLTPAMPFDVCGAMSQGYIGYHIQQRLRCSLKKKDLDIPVATVLTQVVVDRDDPAFSEPTKPVGPFLSEEEARKLEKERGYSVKEDAGRGWRRVVASPMPKRIVELDSVRRLWDSTIVVTCGGGGIPVLEEDGGELKGTAAVIDKDYAAGLLAEEIGADIFMILTEVEQVAVNFNRPGHRNISRMTVSEAKRYAVEGHFAAGSMLPKVMAAVKFVETDCRKYAIIASLNKVREALRGKAGTKIVHG